MSEKNKDSNILIYHLVPYKDFTEGRKKGLVLHLDKQVSVNNALKVVITKLSGTTPIFDVFQRKNLFLWNKKTFQSRELFRWERRRRIVRKSKGTYYTYYKEKRIIISY